MTANRSTLRRDRQREKAEAGLFWLGCWVEEEPLLAALIATGYLAPTSADNRQRILEAVQHWIAAQEIATVTEAQG